LKLNDVIIEVVINVLTEHPLNDLQIAFVVDSDTRLKRLKRFDSLNSDLVILAFEFSNYYFFESLETSLIEYC